MDALNFEARKVALKQDKTGFVLTLSIHPDEIPYEILKDFVGTRYGVAMARINDDETTAPYANRVQRAGILCRNPDFQDFMGTSDETDTALELCKRLGIESRSELNGNEAAQHSFDELTKQFEDSYVPF